MFRNIEILQNIEIFDFDSDVYLSLSLSLSPPFGGGSPPLRGGVGSTGEYGGVRWSTVEFHIFIVEMSVSTL